MKHQTLTTTPEISKRMANVHLKEGKAETKLAKELWRKGLRYPWWQSITTGAMLCFFILLQSVVLMRKNRRNGKK